MSHTLLLVRCICQKHYTLLLLCVPSTLRPATQGGQAKACPCVTLLMCPTTAAYVTL
jgi:hypothetical protein